MYGKIAVLSGDGIGPEIMQQALKVLDRIEAKYGHNFQRQMLSFGGAAIDKYGSPFPEQTKAGVLAANATLLGAVGGPKWDNLSSNRPEAGLLELRKTLKAFANLRPVKIYPELAAASPLKEELISGGVDILIVRELTGGIYFGERGSSSDEAGRYAYDTEKYHETEIRRIAHIAFESAKKRNGRVCSVDKANVLDSSRLWRAVVNEVAAQYPDVELFHMYVDNAAMQLVRNPKQFDVILTSNMFGDILSDEASTIAGSIGMLPSASISTDKNGIYEPIHGSAPDIAGQDKANPIAAILSVAMMLRFSFGLNDEAAAIEAAVEKALQQGYRTADITKNSPVPCSKMGDIIAEFI